MKTMSHPNIVQIKDCFETEDYFYIVMEKINGGELLDHLVDNCMSEHEVAIIMHQILSAISYMQENGIVHRDLKPENIML